MIAHDQARHTSPLPYQNDGQAIELPNGDRRPVTIVALNLRIPPDMDEETIFNIQSLHLQVATTIAEEYHGQIIRRHNGLLLVFGAPISYEDDTERAVNCAVELMKYLLVAENESGHQQTEFAIAVNLGDVVAGQIGSQFHSEFTVTGEPIQLAESIAGHGLPGIVCVTDAVRMKTERLYRYEPAQTSDSAVNTGGALWQVAGRRDNTEPARGLPGIKSRFIGRKDQLGKMLDLSAILNQDIGGLIWIEGEPGVGKSRLMAEFTASIADNGILIWSGASTPQKSGHAFSLIADVITRALKVRPVDTAEQIRTKIDLAIESWPRDASLARPYLEILLGMRPSGIEAERLASLEPDQLRQQVFVSLRRLFQILGKQRPMVLLLDDLHWIDPMSADLLLFLMTMVVSVPILFVCAQRRQGADLPNDRLVKVQSLIPDQTLHLHLSRLSLDDSAELLNELLPQTRLSPDIRQTILKQSDGNPYFIEEYIRMLIAQQVLQHSEDGWNVVEGQDITQAACAFFVGSTRSLPH